MAKSIIKASGVRLESDASKLNSHVLKIQNEIEAIKNDMTSLNTMWEGEAKEAFQDGFRNDIVFSEQIIRELRMIVSFGENAGRKYDRCEKNLMNLIESIRI